MNGVDTEYEGSLGGEETDMGDEGGGDEEEKQEEQEEEEEAQEELAVARRLDYLLSVLS